jgi:hypothetical protein
MIGQRALAGFLLCASLACTRTPATIEQPSEPARAPAPTTATPANVGKDGVTIVLDAGAEPRAPLRYHVQPGQVVRWRSNTSLDMHMQLLGSEVSNGLEFSFDVQTEVLRVDPSGKQIEIRSVFERLDVTRGEAGELTAYVGLEQWTRMNDLGLGLEERYSRDGVPIDPSTVPGLENAVAPTLTFPVEPIGVGARWQKFAEIERNGFMVMQTSEHQLLRWDGNHAKISTKITQEPLVSRVPTEGGYVELTQFETIGLGELVFELDSVVPSHYESKVDFSMLANVVAGDQQSSMGMAMQVVTSVRTIE